MKYLKESYRNKIWFYIAGLLETDGSFLITHSAGQWRYEVKITSKMNRNIIDLLVGVCLEYNIGYRIVKDPKGERGTDLRISGKNQILLFLSLLQSKGTLPFSVKYRDYLIMKVARTQRVLAT